ncbi:MAG TPA: hypothetical protein VMW56_32265 [Candidatus Margulisiibacteriota bacterium]|nr:hypothetical protein [Candidatus Margulisiibacteriota bacterium]
MPLPQLEPEVRDTSVVGHLLATGEMLPSQMPSPSDWSPEKKLAGAVLAHTLIEIRDHHGDPQYRRRIAQDLEWVNSDDTEWPYSFVPLCELFGLEPEYVRSTVMRWTQMQPAEPQRPWSAHRHAA